MCSFESSLERFIFRLTSECAKRQKQKLDWKNEIQSNVSFAFRFVSSIFGIFYVFLHIHKYFTVKYFCFKWRTLTKHRRQAFCTFDFDGLFFVINKIINFFLFLPKNETKCKNFFHSSSMESGDLNFLTLIS